MSNSVAGDQPRTAQLGTPDNAAFFQYNVILDKIFGRKDVAPWALLDFPTHSNVGDSAIWLGSLAILEARFQASPRYVTRNMGFPTDLDKVMPEGPIFFLGGGNFGDLWPGFWEHRVSVIDQFVHRKIVQLPQSIYFVDLRGRALRETQRAISKHPDFTLLVRDKPSLEFAQKAFDCPIYLCSDMAFGLRDLSNDEEASVPALALMRDDLEKRIEGEAPDSLRQYARVTDWIERERPPFSDRAVPYLIKKFPSLNQYLISSLAAAYRRQATRQLRRGIEILSQGDIIITDRLHGHILSTLMRKKHIVLDNSYGKVFNYINTWPDDGFTMKAENIEAAKIILSEFS